MVEVNEIPMFGALWLILVLFLSRLQSAINIIFDRVGKVDPVTRGTEIAVNYLGIQFDVSIIVVAVVT